MNCQQNCNKLKTLSKLGLIRIFFWNWAEFFFGSAWKIRVGWVSGNKQLFFLRLITVLLRLSEDENNKDFSALHCGFFFLSKYIFIPVLKETHMLNLGLWNCWSCINLKITKLFRCHILIYNNIRVCTFQERHSTRNHWRHPLRSDFRDSMHY